jgi:hypothetical protein
MTFDGPSWKWQVVIGVARALLLLVALRVIQKYVIKPVDAGSSAIRCAWEPGISVTLRAYISPESIQVKFMDAPDTFLLAEKTFRLGVDDVLFDVSVPITISQRYKDYYAHVYLTKHGHHPDLTKSKHAFDDDAIAYHRLSLVSLEDNDDDSSLRSLLTSEKPRVKSENMRVLNPNIHIGYYVDDLVGFFPAKYARIDSSGKRFKPIIYGYDEWQLANRRVDHVEQPIKFHFTFKRLSFRKLQALLLFGEAFRAQGDAMHSAEVEQLKEMIMETSAWLLVLTFAVSLLHILFDFLAFKNDVAFWRSKRDDLRGLSVRTVFINAISQLVVFLYLVEQRTSWLILASSAFGTLLDLWKIKKVVRRVYLDSNLAPHVEFHTSGTSTEEHDAQATNYLLLLLIPLLMAYSAYSLIYQRHRSWYSFVLSTSVGFVYAFGFVMMTPQLFINYRLKSVAHLPWRVFTYKALNTFIDDLFAFVIKMPTLHRVACFRDDILFIIYLYQRWIYPTDLGRVNEFGQSFGAEEKVRFKKTKAKAADKDQLTQDPAEQIRRTSARRLKA